jgi:hypothetical protein
LRHFDVLEIAPGVFSISKFLSGVELEQCLTSIKSQALWEKAPLGEYSDNKVVRSFVDLALRDVEVANGEGIDLRPIFANETQIRTFVESRGFRISQFSKKMISRYSLGSHIRSHRDTGTYDTYRMFTIVCYLDTDYLGGEIFFPTLSLVHRPVAGELLFFYSEHEHGVNPVTSGQRHTVIWFAENLNIRRLI